jgi:serine/threonine protein kinase
LCAEGEPVEIRNSLFGAVVVKLGLCTASDVEEALALQEKYRGNWQKAPKLGEALASLGKIPPEQVQAVLSGTLTAKPGRRFGEVLLEMKLLDKDGIVAALKKQKEERKKGVHRPIGRLMVETGIIREEQVPVVLAAQGLSPRYCALCNVVYNVPHGMRSEFYVCPECREDLAERPVQVKAEPQVKPVETPATDLPEVSEPQVVGAPAQEAPQPAPPEPIPVGKPVDEAPPPELAEEPGEAEVYGPFSVVEAIGEDSHSILYRAEDSRGGATVALRVFPDPVLNTPEQRQVMQDAYSRLSKMDHPGMKKILEVGERDGVNYIVEDFVVGKSLRGFMGEGERIHLRTATNIVTQVAEALHAAHLAGVYHLGLRPSLIIVQPMGKVKVGGFGYPKDAISDMRRMAERTGEVSVYAAPELAVEGLPRDHRADIYSLGAVYYHLVTGTPPFRGESVGELLLRMSSEEVPPPASFRDDLPARVSALIQRMLSVEPDQRPADMAEVLRELRGVESLESGMAPVAELTFPEEEAHPEGISPRSRRMRRIRAGSKSGRARSRRIPMSSRRGPAPARGGTSSFTTGIIILGVIVGVLVGALIVVWWLTSKGG